MKSIIHRFLAAILTVGLFTACDTAPDKRSFLPIAKPTGRKAQAILKPTKGNKVQGTVNFIELHKGIRVMAEIKGLPEGEHGFHIHEFGDCSAEDASSAGGHYNPTKSIHAGPDDIPREVGDLGNVVVDSKGNGVYDHVDFTISFDAPNSILGKAVIVHANRDDFVSQPSGNSGAKVACGIITILPEEE